MNQPPSVCDDIYVPTITDETNVYFVGGLAKVIEIVGCRVVVEEHNGANYRWKNGLSDLQETLKMQFGNQRAYSTGVTPPCSLK